MPMQNQTRNRGHVLTKSGLEKFQQAVRQWEDEHSTRCTQDRMRDLTNRSKSGGLDPSTISKIKKGRDGVDLESISCLFQAFALSLESADYILASRANPDADFNFVGREKAIADLKELVRRDAKVIVIQGRGGIGKTTLARKFLKSQKFDLSLEKWMATEPQNITSVESVVEEWLRRYFDEEPGREFGITLDRLRYQLRSSSRRVGILIDTFETALNGDGKLVESHRRYLDLLRILSDPEANCLTVITSRERVHDGSRFPHFEHYSLEGLDLDAWQRFFEERNIQATAAIEAIHAFYNGNAFAMKLVRSAVEQDYRGNAEAYWQDNQGYLPGQIEELVSNQFNRLQQLRPDEYKLLCRLGCYRYQDVFAISLKGVLCLLWEVPESSRRRIVDSLQERSLLACKKEKDQYWLHPVIRMQAVERLRSTEDLELANRQAAAYLSQSMTSIQTTPDALRALEAYYHYLQIDDLPAAADVLIAKRPNRWGTNESLGRSFYKRGLLGQMTSVIRNVVDKLKIDIDSPLRDRTEQAYRKAKLLHTLGAIYWLAGDIHVAICYCQKARQLLHSVLSQPEQTADYDDTVYNLLLVEINALLTTGMCRIGLWELDAALSTLLEAQRLCRSLDQNRNQSDYEQYGCNKYELSILFYIAFLQSCLGQYSEAQSIADRLHSLCVPILSQSLPSWLTEYRLTYLGQTYNNLGDSKKALALYDHVIAYTEKSLHTQAKVKVYNCKAEVYRQQQNLEEAVSYHNKAIETASIVGAKYDLAEALYQQGLTYREMNLIDQSNKSFEEAMQRFRTIQAPKQIERVRTITGANQTDY